MSGHKIDQMISDLYNKIVCIKSRIYDCKLTLSLLEDELIEAKEELAQLKADPKNTE